MTQPLAPITDVGLYIVRHGLRRITSIFLVALFGFGLTQPLLAAGKDEVRVLIDVSGSMKDNDPDNLRVPALRLLVNLLPAGAKSSVWSFAQYVNPMVPADTVGDRWRAEALRAADKIHSRGLFTDIGKGLETVTADWREPDPDTRRSVILLTDGVVDVSKEPGANEAARRQLLSQTLPRLQDLGVTVHTIALSDEADSGLMKSLALGTDGGFEVATSAGELQRIFLRLFEKSVERDTVPLEGNTFQVDGSISELTLLAFKSDDGSPTQLAPPNGQTYGAANAPSNVRWFSETGYDLVTITQPTPGEWRLLAEMDPDNRVMIVTDLQLELSKLPNNVLAGETITLDASLSEDGNTITRKDFLDLLMVQVQQFAPGAPEPRSWKLVDNGLGDDKAGGDGIFSLKLGPTLTPGEHELSVVVDGNTFMREKRHRLQVFDQPLDVNVAPLPDDQAWGYRVTMQPKLDWLDADTMRIGANVVSSDGSASQLSVPKTTDGWELVVPDLDPAQRYTLKLQVQGVTADGRRFDMMLPDIELPPKTAEAAMPAEPPAEQTEPEPKPESEAVEPEEEKKGVNWIFIIIVVITANFTVFGLLGLAYYLMKRRKAKVPGFGDDEAESEDDGDNKK